MAHRNRVRGTTKQRGYGGDWPKHLAQWAAVIANGMGYCTAEPCWLVSRYIPPNAKWDGGHDLQKRPRGPEHRYCNRRNAARYGNWLRAQRQRNGYRPPRPLPSRDW